MAQTARSPSGPVEREPSQPRQKEARRLMDLILGTECFYEQLGVPRGCADVGEMRRMYLLRSRRIHPDRCPGLPRATPAFQALSLAFETLKDPWTRATYNLHGAPGNPSSPHRSADDTLGDALAHVMAEFLAGNFDNILRLADHVASINPALSVSHDSATNFLSSTRNAVLVAQHCWLSAKFEVISLHELSLTLRSLSYFDLVGRSRISLQMLRVLLKIPLVVNTALNGQDRILLSLVQLIIASFDRVEGSIAQASSWFAASPVARWWWASGDNRLKR